MEADGSSGGIFRGADFDWLRKRVSHYTAYTGSDPGLELIGHIYSEENALILPSGQVP